MAIRERLQEASMEPEDERNLVHLLEIVWEIQNKHASSAMHARFEVLRLFALLPIAKFRAAANFLQRISSLADASAGEAADFADKLLTFLYDGLDAELQIAIVFCAMLPEGALFNHAYFECCKTPTVWWKECLMAYFSVNSQEIDQVQVAERPHSIDFDPRSILQDHTRFSYVDRLVGEERKVPAAQILQKLEIRGLLVRIGEKGYVVPNQIRRFCDARVKVYENQNGFREISRTYKLRVVEYIRNILQQCRARSLHDCIRQFRVLSPTWFWALDFLKEELLRDKAKDSAPVVKALSAFVDLLWAVRRNAHQDIFDSDTGTVAEGKAEIRCWTKYVSILRDILKRYSASLYQIYHELPLLNAKVFLMQAMSVYDRHKVDSIKKAQWLCDQAIATLQLQGKESVQVMEDNWNRLHAEILILQGLMKSYDNMPYYDPAGAEEKWTQAEIVLNNIKDRSSECTEMQYRRLYFRGNFHMFAHEKQGSRKEAENFYRPALEICKAEAVLPNSKAMLQHTLGECLLKSTKKWLRAGVHRSSDTTTVLEQQPRSHHHQGATNGKQKPKKQRAKKEAQQSVEINEHSVESKIEQSEDEETFCLDKVLERLDEAKLHLEHAVKAKEQFANSKIFLTIKRLCQSYRTLSDVEVAISLFKQQPISCGDSDEKELENRKSALRRLARAAKSPTEQREALDEVSKWCGAICFPLCQIPGTFWLPKYMAIGDLIKRLQVLALSVTADSLVSHQLDFLAELNRTWADLKMALLGQIIATHSLESGASEENFHLLNMVLLQCPVCNILTEMVSKRFDRQCPKDFVEATRALHYIVRFPGETAVRDQRWQECAIKNLKTLLQQWEGVVEENKTASWFIAGAQQIVSSLIFTNDYGSAFAGLDKFRVLLMCIKSKSLTNPSGGTYFYCCFACR